MPMFDTAIPSPSSAVVPAGSRTVVLRDPRLHQLSQERGRQLALIRELDEALTGVKTCSFHRSLLCCKERRREPQRAVILEVLEHPQARFLLAADIHRQGPP